MTNATEALLRFSKQISPQIDQLLATRWGELKQNKAIVGIAATAPQRRWEKAEHVFEVAIDDLRKYLAK
jgi:hypothetical protein